MSDLDEPRKTPREVAEEMVTQPRERNGGAYTVRLADDAEEAFFGDWATENRAARHRGVLIGIIERLIARERAPLEADLVRHRQSILALTDELNRVIGERDEVMAERNGLREEVEAARLHASTVKHSLTVDYADVEETDPYHAVAE